MLTDLARTPTISLPHSVLYQDETRYSVAPPEASITTIATSMMNDGPAPLHSEQRRGTFRSAEHISMTTSGTRSSSAPPNPSAASLSNEHRLLSVAEEKGAAMVHRDYFQPTIQKLLLVASSGSGENPEFSKIDDSSDPDAAVSAAAISRVAFVTEAHRTGGGAAAEVVAATRGRRGAQGDGSVAVASQSSNSHSVSVVYPVAAAAYVPLVRPHPVKTTPPISSGNGVTLVAPKPLSVTRIQRPTTIPLQQSSPSSHYKTTEETLQKERGRSTEKAKPPWCDEATTLARQAKEENKRRKAEEQRRRQEIQCNFPEQDVPDQSMAPTSGRTPMEDGIENGHGGAHHDVQRKQQQKPTHNGRTSSGSSEGNGNKGTRSNNIFMRASEDGERAMHQQPAPLFERLVTEEVQEIKSYVRIIENQSRQLSELERCHGDLEARLELESRGRQQLEATLEAREREWAHKFNELESERDHWKAVVQAEQTKNSRLIDQVVRKDQDIHRMLQRKVRYVWFEGFCLFPLWFVDRAELTFFIFF